MERDYDFAIIGAGIIGSAIARELVNRKRVSVVVIEKEREPGMHASGRNSGVIHSGFNYKSGTLKAKLCVEGNSLLLKYCRERGVPFEQCGTLVVSRTEQERRRLETLLAQGTQNGVPGIRIIDRAELVRKEPLAEGTHALFSPTGSIVDSQALVTSIVQDSIDKGAEYVYTVKVNAINRGVVITNKGEIRANHVINAAGLYADRLAHSEGIGMDYQVVAIRGEYRIIEGLSINSMIYSPHNPDLPFLGVHLTKRMGGSVIAGPTATIARGRESYDGKIQFKDLGELIFSRAFWKMATSHDMQTAASYYRKLTRSREFYADEINSLITSRVRPDQLKPFRPGNRAQVIDGDGKLVEDFIVIPSKRATHIINAVSPGLTSSLSFAKYIVDNYLR